MPMMTKGGCRVQFSGRFKAGSPEGWVNVTGPARARRIHSHGLDSTS